MKCKIILSFFELFFVEPQFKCVLPSLNQKHDRLQQNSHDRNACKDVQKRMIDTERSIHIRYLICFLFEKQLFAMLS